MEMTLWLLLLALFSGNSITAPSSCPTFGTTLQDSNLYSHLDGLILNVRSPSQCHGNVTQWRFCFERSSTGSNEVQFMVFRQNGRTSTYDRLEGSHMVFQESNLPTRECRSIDANQEFEIQPNDIVAACLKSQGSTYPFRVTSFSMREALQITSISDNCIDDDLKSINLVSLNSRTINLLLVEAVINSTTECRIGHNPAPSTPIQTSGILINSQFPAQGSGLVTSWNYCYYTDSLSFSGTYSATFAVWRNDNTSSSVAMVTESSLTVTLQPQYTIASIYCLVIELEPENHFIVREGDYENTHIIVLVQNY